MQTGLRLAAGDLPAPRRSTSGADSVRRLARSFSDSLAQGARSFSDSNAPSSLVKSLSFRAQNMVDGSDALLALEASTRWLSHVPALVGILAILFLQNFEFESDMLHRPHRLAETTNFLVAAVSFAPILFTSVFSRTLVKATQMARRRAVTDGNTAAAAGAHITWLESFQEQARWLPAVTYLGMCLKLMLIDVRGCSASAAAQRLMRWRPRRWRPLNAYSPPARICREALMSETVVSGLVPTALAGILLLGIVAVSLRRLLMSILEARQTAMRELDRAHSFVRLLYIAQAICFCNVLVTAWSSPPLVSPLAFNRGENPCTHVGRLYMLLRCAPSRALHGPHTVCQDGGYASAYYSAHAACAAARAQEGFLATTVRS